MRPYSPGGILNTLAPNGTLEAPHPSIHRLQLGLPGYLILFAPLAFAPQRQLWTSHSLSPLAFLLISTHFTAPPGIPVTSPTLEAFSIEGTSWVKPRDFTFNLKVRLRALYAQ